MKTSFILTLCVLTSQAWGRKPHDVPLADYTKLWTDSPFTSDPPAPDSTPRASVFQDLAVLGVSSLGENNYRVTLVKKSAPDAERIYIESGDADAAYQIVKVNRTPGNPTGTVVTLSTGGVTGPVTYDEKLLAIAPAKKVETKHGVVPPAISGKIISKPPLPPGIIAPGVQPKTATANTPRPRLPR